MHKASCLCQAITVTTTAELKGPDACHCQACRKTSGHYFASVEVPKSSVSIEGEEHLTWYQSSEKVRRGFCSVCGSSLLWEPVFRDWTAIAMGAFDGPTQAKLALHIYTADKGDYYEIADGLPQNPQ